MRRCTSQVRISRGLRNHLRIRLCGLFCSPMPTVFPLRCRCRRQCAAMPADLSHAAQLHCLRQQLERDVTELVHDEAVCARLLQRINARFQSSDRTPTVESAVELAADGPQKQECDTATCDARQRQEQQEQAGGASSGVHFTSLPADLAPQPNIAVEGGLMKSKRRKKKDSASSRSGGVESAEQLVVHLASPPQPLALSTPSPSAVRDVELLPAAAVAPVRLDYNASSGRLIRATAPLPAGARLLDDRGYCAVVKLERCSSVCALCHTAIDGDRQSKLSCSECRVAHYCSARCRTLDASYRHATECRMLAAVGKLSGSESVDADLLQMLAAVCARRYRETHRDQYPCSSTDSAPTGSVVRQSSSGSAAEEEAEAARWRDDELVSSE